MPRPAGSGFPLELPNRCASQTIKTTSGTKVANALRVPVPPALQGTNESHLAWFMRLERFDSFAGVEVSKEIALVPSRERGGCRNL
jgi:hypothetical protein